MVQVKFIFRGESNSPFTFKEGKEADFTLSVTLKPDLFDEFINKLEQSNGFFNITKYVEHRKDQKFIGINLAQVGYIIISE